jgi:hypothetical protein
MLPIRRTERLLSRSEPTEEGGVNHETLTVADGATVTPNVLAAGTHANAAAFTPGYHGFLDTSGSFTQIDVSGATPTLAAGINDTGQIVGLYVNFR